MDLQITPEVVFCNDLLIQDNECLVFILYIEKIKAEEND